MLKKPTAKEITDAAEAAALKVKDGLGMSFSRCNPDGAWHNFQSINGFYNPGSPSEQEECRIERPISYKLFVHTYLLTQGWRR